MMMRSATGLDDRGPEAAAVEGDGGEVNNGGAERGSEQAEGAGGRAGEGPAGGAAGPGSGQDAQVYLTDPGGGKPDLFLSGLGTTTNMTPKVRP